VGGGKVEAKAILVAQEFLKRQESICGWQTWNLQKDLGMSCGGEITLLFEGFLAPSWNIAIFGAGHVSQALVRALLPLACQMEVIDPRPQWMERLPDSKKINRRIVEEPALQIVSLPKNTFIVVMTQGHSTDFPILKEALHWGDFGFLGVLGSRVKAEKLKRELMAAGAQAQCVEKIHCPLGLPLGKDTPEEMAISIAAQLLQIRGLEEKVNANS
jgi:xanthine dehydrogenase accessory factor